MSEKIFKLKGKTLVIVDWANVYGWSKKLKWEIDPKKLYDYLKNYSEIFDIKFYFGVDSNDKKSKQFQENIKDIGYNLKTKELKWVPVQLEASHFKKVVKNLFDVLDNVSRKNSEISNKFYELKQDLEKRVEGYEDTIDVDGEPGNPVITGVYPSYDEEAYNYIFNAIEELDADLKKLNIDVAELQKELKEPVLRRKCDFDCEISLEVLNDLDKFESLVLFSGDGDYAAIVDELIRKQKQVIVVFARGHKGKEFEDFKKGLYLCSVEKLKKYLK